MCFLFENENENSEKNDLKNDFRSTWNTPNEEMAVDIVYIFVAKLLLQKKEFFSFWHLGTICFPPKLLSIVIKSRERNLEKSIGLTEGLYGVGELDSELLYTALKKACQHSTVHEL